MNDSSIPDEMDKASDLRLAERLVEAREQLLAEIGKIIYGQHEVLDLMLLSLLCRGHVLLLGVPGLGKTLMARTMSDCLNMSFRRIQFTPDLMPSDIVGTDMIEEDPDTGRRRMRFLLGPVFANFLLADEINRTPPKTQAALLQAMQEREVSVGGNTYPLEPPFMVVATQNPIEAEGTYLLPEAQLDRFMFCVRVFYPDPAEEREIVKGTTGRLNPTTQRILNAQEILQLQDIVRGVPVADDVIDYAVRLASASRPDDQHTVSPDVVSKYVTWGASPRASQYLILGSKALALCQGRYCVNFSDVRQLAPSVLRHRLVLNFRSRADKVTSDELVQELLQFVPE